MAVQERECEVGPIMGDQIHEQERDVVHHVDPAQRRIEFQAIERHQSFAPTHDVAGMQIAMTFPDEALPFTLPQYRKKRVHRIVSPVDESVELSEARRAVQIREETAEIAEDCEI